MTLPPDFYHVDVRLPLKSGITKDYPHFGLNYIFLTGSPSTTDFNHLTTDIAAFLNTSPTGGSNPINSYLGKEISLGIGAGQIRYYHMPTTPGPAGPPAFLDTFSVGSTDTTSFPSQCAVAASIAADLTGVPEFGPGGTRPRSDRRNRFYLGPIGGFALQNDVTTWKVSVKSAFRTDLTLAMKQFLQAAAFAHSWSWQVFSRKNWSSLAALTGSVDDVVDTIRRRVPEPSTRTSITF